MLAFTNDHIEPLVSYALAAVCTLNKDENENFNLILWLGKMWAYKRGGGGGRREKTRPRAQSNSLPLKK